VIKRAVENAIDESKSDISRAVKKGIKEAYEEILTEKKGNQE